MELFSGAAANGNYPTTPASYRDGKKTIAIAGTWDGATATLQISLDGGSTWVSVGADGVFTADGVITLEYTGGLLRFNLADVGTTSLKAWILPG